MTVEAPRPDTQRVRLLAGTSGQLAIARSIDSVRTVVDDGAIALLGDAWTDSGPPQQVDRLIRTTVLTL